MKAIVLDFSSVNNVDITSVQNLIDVRNQLDRYAAPDTVDWHFACINNRWTKRALAAAGFGYYTPEADLTSGLQRWKPVFSVAEIGGSSSAAAAAEARDNRRAQQAARAPGKTVSGDIEERIADTDDNDSLDKQLSSSKAYGDRQQRRLKIAVVQGLNRPLFHIDITAALESALANVQRKSH